jgi:hypothetical protein
MNLEQDIAKVWRDARDIKVTVCSTPDVPDPERLRRDLLEAAHNLEAAAWHIADDAGCRKENAE